MWGEVGAGPGEGASLHPAGVCVGEVGAGPRESGTGIMFAHMLCSRLRGK